ncbi:hypothetical protein, partial [Legionella genomosp. 1]|uniref:hypothetical protein n=1 Tax=Legionella genomosp. 1 TaxID=1093625 RepID=UPI001C9E4A5F
MPGNSQTVSRHPERSEGSPESGSVLSSLRSFATLWMTYLGSFNAYTEKNSDNSIKSFQRHPERSEGSPESGSVPSSLRSFATLWMTYLG